MITTGFQRTVQAETAWVRYYLEKYNIQNRYVENVANFPIL